MHVLEHMVFKGTTRHGAADISRWVEVARRRAERRNVQRIYALLYGPIPAAAGARHAVHLTAELLCRATLDEKEWARECPVILEEMKRRNDDAETMAWELFQNAIYADEAHSRAVIGSRETVSACSAEDVRRFYRAHYTAANTLIVIAGDFKSQDALRWLRKEFGSMPRGQTRLPRPDSRLHQVASHRRLQKSVQQAYAIYGFPTPPATHPDQEALDLLAVLLGDGRNARLVHTLREEKKLVWSVGALEHYLLRRPGIFAVFAECSAQHRSKVGPGVRNILHDLKKHPPTAEEIQRAKNLIQTSWLQGYETFHNQASTLGAYALDHHLKRLQHYLPKILSLSLKDLRRVIDTYFFQDLCTAVVEP